MISTIAVIFDPPARILFHLSFTLLEHVFHPLNQIRVIIFQIVTSKGGKKPWDFDD